MLTKKILVGLLAIVPLAAACSADASDSAATDSEALASDTQAGAAPCDPRNPDCQCHSLESCNALEKICVESGGKMACSDPQTCFCTWPAQALPSSPSRITRATSGMLAR